MYLDLDSKVAVVTGASSGIGADAARAYASCGVSVALLARRFEKVSALADELKSLGAEALAVKCDVTDEVSVKNGIDKVLSRFGKIDILLNNAGISILGGVHTLDQEEWDKAMDANVKGSYLTSKYVVPGMIERQYGKIVNIASLNTIISVKDDTYIRHAYNASKAAVLGLSLGMACSYGKYGITVNSLCPGLFETEMTRDTLFSSEEFIKQHSEKCPISRPGAPGEVNGAILFFSSDASSYVTGQCIAIDGGLSLV